MNKYILFLILVYSSVGCKRNNTKKEVEDYLIAGTVLNSCSGTSIPLKDTKVKITAVKFGSSWSYNSLEVGTATTDDNGNYSTFVKTASFEIDYYSIEYSELSKTKSIRLNYDSIQNLKTKKIIANCCFD
jgi:hypothetical protein